MEPAESDPFVAGIYNYCDRWCERCSLTARCRLFAMEQESPVAEDARDVDNAAFWESLHKVFEQTKQMVREMAEQMGVDIDESQLDPHAEVPGPPVEQESVIDDATGYLPMVDRWFKDNESAFEEKKDQLVQQAVLAIEGLDPEAEAMKLSDACDVVRWYQFQIVAKLTRALSQDLGAGLVDDPADDVLASDRDGSAKVALIGIDRSIAAWTILREAFADQRDSVLDLLVHLERLRRDVETRIPQARSFVRPGFDTADP